MEGIRSSASPSLPTEVGEAEVLTGAELYHYLLEENNDQLRRAEEKISEYTSLKATLGSITDRCRRSLLAPVANGLAYFEAELETTNNILVLLGDGWFVERSAAQAADIAQRRLDYLRREREVLQGEKNSLMDRRELFLQEVPEAEAALQKVAASSTRAAATTAPAAATTDGRSQSSREEEEVDLANLQDPELAIFDEQDELTEEELIALEEELADHIDDDEYVEKVMMERMIAKKEARVRAELARRSQREAKPDDPSLTQQRDHPTEGPPQSQEGARFRTPADIVAAYAAEAVRASAVCVPAESDATGEEKGAKKEGGEAREVTGPSPPTKKSVSFSETVEERHVGAVAPTTAPLAQPGPPLPPPPSTERVTYAVGDIVEHDVKGRGSVGGPGGGIPALSPVFPSPSVATAAAPRKRRSLFQQEMDGE